VVDALAQLLRQVPPEHLLSALPSAMQTELRGQPADDLAASLVEDATVGWIATHLAAAPAGPAAAAAEEQAIRVMTIGLTMTQAADRLLEKLARILEEANLPPETYQRIRHGVLWGGLSESERRERLLQATQYDDQEFQGLLDYVKECLGARKYDPALEVATHYFCFLDASSSIVQAELPRALQLLRLMAEPPTLSFLLEVAERLGTELLDEHQLTPECHAAVAEALAGVVRMATAAGDLDPAHRAGTVLEQSRARDPRRHEACCGAALGRLLPPEAVPRLIDVYLEKRGDAGLSRTTVELLRWLGSASGEEAFRRLAEEAETPRRPLLLRLLTQLGPGGVEAAHRRLDDARWSVVRDACSVLGDLDDPELPQRMPGVLRHPERRVQQAAVAALVKSRAAGAMATLADALPVLEPGAAEKALEELAFRKDPATIDGLERFLQLSKGTKPGALDTAVRVVAVIPTERAARVLGVVLSDPAHAPLLRRTAGDHLLRSSLPIARRLLEGFVRRTPDDPIAAMIQKALPRDTAP
jgi:HEAT repeat protein